LDVFRRGDSFDFVEEHIQLSTCAKASVDKLSGAPYYAMQEVDSWK